MRGLAVAVVFWLGACATITGDSPEASPSPTPSPKTIVAHLRTEDRGSGCFQNNLGPLRLEGDPTASEDEQVWLVWLTPEYADVGDKAWPIWPVGWTGVFGPDLRILDEDGKVVLVQGQKFFTAGTVEAKDSIYVCAPTPAQE